MSWHTYHRRSATSAAPPAGGPSQTTRPLLSSITRSAMREISRLWVTTITVWPARGLLLEDVEHLYPGVVVEVAGRLVGDKDRVAGGQGAGDGDSLLLTTRQLAGVVHGGRRAPPGERILTDPGATPVAGDLDCALHVLHRGERGEQVERLEDEGDGVAAQLEQLGRLAPVSRARRP